jgi:hypothetical protein
MIYLSSVPFGKVTMFSAVLPTAVVSALILVVIYWIGAIHSRHWGLFAVPIALFTHEFVSRSRSLTPDQYVSLATALSFYLAYSANVYGRKKRLWLIPLVLVASFCIPRPDRNCYSSRCCVCLLSFQQGFQAVCHNGVYIINFISSLLQGAIGRCRLSGRSGFCGTCLENADGWAHQ